MIQKSIVAYNTWDSNLNVIISITAALPTRTIKVNAVFLNEVNDSSQVSFQPDGDVDKCCIMIQFGPKRE